MGIIINMQKSILSMAVGISTALIIFANTSEACSHQHLTPWDGQEPTLSLFDAGPHESLGWPGIIMQTTTHEGGRTEQRITRHDGNGNYKSETRERSGPGSEWKYSNDNQAIDSSSETMNQQLPKPAEAEKEEPNAVQASPKPKRGCGCQWRRQQEAKRRKKEAQKLEEAKAKEEAEPEGEIPVGNRVMARYPNGHYYPAVVNGVRSILGKIHYEIEWEDGDTDHRLQPAKYVSALPISKRGPPSLHEKKTAVEERTLDTKEGSSEEEIHEELDYDALVKETLESTPPRERGLRKEWLLREGWGRKEALHAGDEDDHEEGYEADAEEMEIEETPSQLSSYRGDAKRRTSGGYKRGDWVDVQVLGSNGLFTGEYARALVTGVKHDGSFDLVDQNGLKIKPALKSGIQHWHLRHASAEKEEIEKLVARGAHEAQEKERLLQA